MENKSSITSVSGRAISVRGNDIDTDRIIPARFLKCVTFEALGPHAFEDDRASLKEKGKTHPFDEPKFKGANILLVNKNFGCGSSREHAPQSLKRWGIDAIIGESFAEIFFGNCVSLGIPCATVSSDLAEKIQAAAEANPEANWELNLESLSLSGPVEISVNISDSTLKQFLKGSWNPMQGLLNAMDLVHSKAASLPYV